MFIKFKFFIYLCIIGIVISTSRFIIIDYLDYNKSKAIYENEAYESDMIYYHNAYVNGSSKECNVIVNRVKQYYKGRTSNEKLNRFIDRCREM